MIVGALRRLPLWQTTVALLIAGLWAGQLCWLHLAGRPSVLDRLENASADMRLLLFEVLPPPSSVAIVAIDDAFVDASGGYPIPREKVAAIVRAIAASGAKVLAVDMLFVDAGDERSNRLLAAALGTIPTVIAGAGRFDPAADRTAAIARTSAELWPLAIFADAAAVGPVNISIDVGGTPRHLPMILQTSRGLLPTLVLQASGLFAGGNPAIRRDAVVLNGRERPVDLGWNLPLRYYGPRGTIATLSAVDLLSGKAGMAESLRGRVVVLGATATAVGDTFNSPFDRVLPGAEVLATGIANLVDGPVLRRDSLMRRIDASATLTLALAGVLLVGLLPLALAMSITGALMAVWLGIATLLYGEGIWLAMALPLAGWVPITGLLVLVRQRQERRQSVALAQIGESLGRLQAPALARRIEADPLYLDEPVEQIVAVVFVDLSGFTGLSEHLGPAGTQRLLKDFHRLVDQRVVAEDGVVMNYMGDGAMIVFGLPETRVDDASRALRAAFAIAAAVGRWSAASRDGERISGVRLGLHYGSVVLSRLGGDTHQHITATGDSVNLASRLMEVAKAQRMVIAASSELVAAAEMKAIGVLPETKKTLDIRGRVQPVEVYSWGPGSIGGRSAP